MADAFHIGFDQPGLSGVLPTSDRPFENPPPAAPDRPNPTDPDWSNFPEARTTSRGPDGEPPPGSSFWAQHSGPQESPKPDGADYAGSIAGVPTTPPPPTPAPGSTAPDAAGLPTQAPPAPEKPLSADEQMQEWLHPTTELGKQQAADWDYVAATARAAWENDKLIFFHQDAEAEAVGAIISGAKAKLGVTLEDPTHGGYHDEAVARVISQAQYQSSGRYFDPNNPEGFFGGGAAYKAAVQKAQMDIFDEKREALAEKIKGDQAYDRAGENSDALAILAADTPGPMLAAKQSREANVSAAAAEQNVDSPLVRAVASFVGEQFGGLGSPVNDAALMFGAGLEPTLAKMYFPLKSKVFKVISDATEGGARQAAINMGLTGTLAPAQQAVNEERGEDHGLVPFLHDLEDSGLSGFVPGALIHGVKALDLLHGVDARPWIDEFIREVKRQSAAEQHESFLKEAAATPHDPTQAEGPPEFPPEAATDPAVREEILLKSRTFMDAVHAYEKMRGLEPGSTYANVGRNRPPPGGGAPPPPRDEAPPEQPQGGGGGGESRAEPAGADVPRLEGPRKLLTGPGFPQSPDLSDAARNRPSPSSITPAAIAKAEADHAALPPRMPGVPPSEHLRTFIEALRHGEAPDVFPPPEPPMSAPPARDANFLPPDHLPELAPSAPGVVARTTGYEGPHADLLQNRIEHLQRQVDSGTLSGPREDDFRDRIKTFGDHIANRESGMKEAGVTAPRAAEIRGLHPGDVITAKGEDGGTVTGEIRGWGRDHIAVYDAEGVSHSVKPATITNIIKGARGGAVNRVPSMAPGETFAHNGKPVTTGLRFPARDLRTDAATYQYKAGGDSNGVTDRLQTVRKWNPLSVGNVVVHERLDGNRYIVDGHQRRGLAERIMNADPSQDISLPGFLFKEADGWTPEDVRAEAAAKNIREGLGDTLDIARILRDKPEIWDDSLPIGRGDMKEARGLANLSDEAWVMAVNTGKPRRDYASFVGNMAEDKSTHLAILDDLIKYNPKTQNEARMIIADAMQAGFNKSEQVDLFGPSEVTTSLRAERAQVYDAVQGLLKDDKKIFGMLSAEAPRIIEAGNVLTDTNAERADQAGQLLQGVITLATRAGPISSALNRAAQRVADGEHPKTAARTFLNELPALLNQEGLRVADVPMAPKYDLDQPGAREEQVRDLDAEFMATQPAMFAEPQRAETERTKPAAEAPAAGTSRPEAAAPPAIVTGDPLIDRITSDPYVLSAITDPVINRANDVPYGAGPNKANDRVVNIDRHVPKTDTIKGVKYDPARAVAVHEQVEKHALDQLTAAGIPEAQAYEVAHFVFAEPAERAWVGANVGPNAWNLYQKHWDKWLAPIDHENPANPPSDLYQKPYPHDDDHLAPEDRGSDKKFEETGHHNLPELRAIAERVFGKKALGEAVEGGKIGDTEATVRGVAHEIAVAAKASPDPLDQQIGQIMEREIAPLIDEAFPPAAVEPEPPAPPPIPESAQNHANDLAGRVAYHNGDLALVQGFSALTGKPVYVGAKGDMRARHDIETDKTTLFTPAERAELVAAKRAAVAADEAAHAANPDGPFAGGKTFAASPSVPENLASFAKGLIDLVGIKERVYLTTVEDARAAEDLHGPYAAIRSAGVDSGTFGTTRRLPNGDHYIAISVRPSEQLNIETVSHEVGHIVEKTSWLNAPAEVKAAVDAEYEKWRDAQRAPGVKARDLIRSTRTPETAETITLPDENLSASDLNRRDTYWTAKDEWFADQVARWAMSSKKPMTLVEKFFAGLAALLRKIHDALGSAFKPVKSMKDWLDSLIPTEIERDERAAAQPQRQLDTVRDVEPAKPAAGEKPAAEAYTREPLVYQGMSYARGDAQPYGEIVSPFWTKDLKQAQVYASPEGFVRAIKEKDWENVNDVQDQINRPGKAKSYDTVAELEYNMKAGKDLTEADFHQEAERRSAAATKEFDKAFAAKEAPVETSPLRDRIREAYERFAGGERGKFMPLSQLRAALPDVDRPSMDRELLSILQGRAGDRSLIGFSDPKSISAAERAAEFSSGGEPYHMLHIGPGDRAPTEAGPEGTQQILAPGMTPVTDADRMRVGSGAPLRGGNQAMPAGGLFDETARAQTDLMDMFPTGDGLISRSEMEARVASRSEGGGAGAQASQGSAGGAPRDFEDYVRDMAGKGQLDPDDADAIIEKYRDDMKRKPPSRARSDGEKAAQFAKIEKARRDMLGAKAKDQLLKDVSAYRTPHGAQDMVEAMYSLWEGFGHAGYPGVKQLHEAYLGLIHGKMADVLNAYPRTAISGRRRQTVSMKELRKASFGENADPKAVALYQSFADAAEFARTKFNELGGAIPKMEKWGLPQSHNEAAVARAFGGKTPAEARKKWVDYVNPMLNWPEMFDPMTGEKFGKIGDNGGPPMDINEERKQAILGHVWNTIVTGGDISRRPSLALKGRGSIATQRLDHRFLVFKDADSASEYNRQFGTGDEFTQMMEHLHSMASDIAIMHRFGPNPAGMVEYTKQLLTEQAAKAMTGEPHALKANHKNAQNRVVQANKILDGFFEQYRGDRPARNALAIAGTIARNWATGSLLGASAIPHAASNWMIQSFARYAGGVPFMRVLPELLRAFSHSSHEEMLRAGLDVENGLFHIGGGAHQLGKWQKIANWSNWLPDRVTHWFGLTPIVEANKGAFYRGMMATLADLQKTNWKDLPDKIRSKMQGYGLRERDWRVMQTAQLYAPAIGSAKWLRPIEVEDGGAPDDAARHEQILQAYGRTSLDPTNDAKEAARIAQDVGLKMRTYMQGEREIAVPANSMRARARIYGDTDAGTWRGQFWRSMGLFKGFIGSFMVGQIHSVVSEMARSRWRGAAYVAALMTGMTLGGMLSLQLKQAKAGKDFAPMNPLTKSGFVTWLRAMLTGGSFGIFGDFLASERSSFGVGPLETLAGPVAEWPLSAAEGVVDEVKSRFAGKTREPLTTTLGDAAVKFARGNTPFLSTGWATQAAWNRILDHVLMSFDRNAYHKQRLQEQHLRNDTGQAFSWRPGQWAPDRLPRLTPSR